MENVTERNVGVKGYRAEAIHKSRSIISIAPAPAGCRAILAGDDGSDVTGEHILFFGVWFEKDGTRRAGPLLAGECGDLVPCFEIENYKNFAVRVSQ